MATLIEHYPEDGIDYGEQAYYFMPSGFCIQLPWEKNDHKGATYNLARANSTKETIEITEAV